MSLFDLDGNKGKITGIRKKQFQSEHYMYQEWWEIELDWPEDSDAMYPREGCMYIGTALDDNGYPFVEVRLGNDPPVPWGFAKRQLDDKERVGFSETEKTRIKFLSNGEAEAAGEKERAEYKARQLEESKPSEEQKRREQETQEKNIEAKAARDKENAEHKARQLEERKHLEEQKKWKKEAQEKARPLGLRVETLSYPR